MFTMEIKIREIEVEDYKELLDFMKKVKGETNFLLGYPDEIKLSYEDEKEHIKKVKTSETSNYFVVMKNNKMIGCIGFNGNTARKMKHYGTIGISVLKEYWGRGIATTLLEKLISWSKEKGIKKINLDVFENNERAIKLYEKFGFKLEGCIEDGIFDGENYINLLVYGLKI
ncbi:N-acetyltransferase [Fusobacterium pseudoperiodonticum]|uniref:N-acetyltransferase n=2 Tax=Fusobacterium pseudoperiodonticum TaxID=2663009 RepID=A0A2D3PNT2_9FUSO|nr:N-acetyltransferase [Fusobacterium pseudoperiodonticum]